MNPNPKFLQTKICGQPLDYLISLGLLSILAPAFSLSVGLGVIDFFKPPAAPIDQDQVLCDLAAAEYSRNLKAYGSAYANEQALLNPNSKYCL